jgi:rod shape-determining protein MreB
MRVTHSIQIGECTAERVKRELGAACEKTPVAVSHMEVVGKHLSNGAARPVEIDSSEVRSALEPVLAEIIRGIRRVIEEAHPEVTADLYYYGVILTGGGALLTGMAERLRDELELHVILAEEPLLSVALGAGRLLEDPDKLERAAIRQDIRVWEAAPELVVNW